MAGFRIAEGFIEVRVDDSQVLPQVRAALQNAAVGSRQTAQNAGQHIGQHLAAGIRDGSQQGITQAGQQGGNQFSQGFNASAGSALKAGLAGLAVGAGAVFVQGFTSAVEQGNVTAKLQAQLGATPAEAKKYGDVAGRLYTSGITDTFEEGANAIKGVMQQGLLPPDASNAQIASIAGKVTNLSKTFDMDLGGATNAVAQMMKTGLAKNAQEALDIMTRGAQTGADKAGDLADTFNEYGTQFRKVGLSGEQAMGLMSQGLKAGARDADIVADSIKEFSIRAVNGSKSTAQGFQALGLNADDMASKVAAGGKTSAGALDLTLDKLRAIKDPAERSRVAVMLFGTQAEDMGDALYALDPSKAVDTLGKVGGAADKMGKTLHSGPTAAITQFKRTLEQNFTKFIGSTVLPVVGKLVTAFTEHLLPPILKIASIAGTVLGPAIRGLGTAFVSTAKFIRDWQDVIVPLAAGIAAFTLVINAQKIALAAWSLVTKGVSAVTKAWTAVQAAFNVVMAMNPFVLVAAAVIGLGVALVVAYKKSETFRNIVDGAFKAVGKAWDWVWDKLKQGFELLKNLFMNFTGPGLLLKHWDSIKKAAGAAWDWVKDKISTALTFVKNLFMNFTGPGLILKHWDSIKAGAKAAWDWVTGKVRDALKFIQTSITTTMGAARKIWDDAWGAIRKFFSDTWAKVQGAVSDAWRWLRTSFSTLKTAVLKVWSDQWAAIKKKFTDIWADVKGAVDRAWTWLKTSFATLKTAVAKVWADQWKAIKDKFTGTWGDIKGAVDRAWTWLKTSFSNLKTAVSKVWSDQWNGLKQKAEDLWGKIKEGVNRFKDAVVSSFTKAKDKIGEAWGKLQDLAKKPVNFIIGTVYNKGIRKVWNAVVGAFGGKQLGEVKGLARGGVLPGTSTYRDGDDQLVPMRKGEGVYVSEAMKDPYERARLHAVNKAAMRGKSLTEYQHGFALGGIFDGIGDVASGAWDKIKKGASWLKDSFGDAVKSGVKTVVNPLIKQIPGGNTGFVNMLKNGMKKAVDLLIGAGNKGDSLGGGAAVAAALNWARTQAGKPYQWGGAGNPSWDCSGFMSGIQKKILGQNPKGRLWSTFSFQGNSAPDGWKRNLKAPFMIGITNKDKGHTAGTINGVNVESRGGRGVVVGKDARGYKDHLFNSWYGFKPSMGGGGGKEGTVFAPGSGVGRWRDEVVTALKQLRLSTGWQDTVLRRMNQESGGDPNVVNKWDSNWKAGHPSVGLMQVIKGTFDAYADGHRSTGPFAYGVSKAPVPNIYAGLNYANSRYGSLAGLNRAGGYDSGGWLPPGATLAVNKTGKPEAVLTNEEAQTFRRMVQNPNQLGGVNVVVNWSTLTLPSKADTRKLAVLLRDAIRDEERARR